MIRRSCGALVGASRGAGTNDGHDSLNGKGGTFGNMAITRARRWGGLFLALTLVACGSTHVPAPTVMPAPSVTATTAIRPATATASPMPRPTVTSTVQPTIAPILTPAQPPSPMQTPTLLPAVLPGHPWAFFGDSITERSNYPELVCAGKGCTPVEHNLRVWPRPAITGTTLQSVPLDPLASLSANAAFAQRVGRLPIETLVVLFGTNDYLAASQHPETGINLATWRQAWEYFHGQVAQMATHPRVVVCGMVYTTGTYNGLRLSVPYGYDTPQQAVAAMDAVTRDEALRHGAVFVSLAEMTRAMIGDDGIHPNQTGSNFIATKIIAAT